MNARARTEKYSEDVMVRFFFINSTVIPHLPSLIYTYISWWKVQVGRGGERIGARHRERGGIVSRHEADGSKDWFQGHFPDGAPGHSGASGVQVHEPQHSNKITIW
jgi:hypothetical protein